MRLFLASLALLPAAAMAEEFTLRSAPQAVTVYPYLAQVTRHLSVALPQGAHQILLPDLPEVVDPRYLRVSVSGAALSSTQFRRDAVAPQPAADSAEIAAAKDRIKAAQAALRALDDQIDAAKLGVEAAKARQGFLGALGSNQGLAADAATLRDLSLMIGTESLAAQQAALAAQQAARDLTLGRADLEQDLKDAEAALAALTPPPERRAQLRLDLAAPAAAEAEITLQYLVEASWAPTYDIALVGKEDPQIHIRRGAVVTQYSGESWPQVALSLSSLAPSGQTAPSTVRERRHVLLDPAPPRPKLSRQMADSAESLADPVIEAPVIVEEAGGMANFDGPGVRYDFAAPVSIASGVDDLRVAFDQISFAADRFARAVPQNDETAFLMARFENTSAEPLLPADEVALFVDNTLVGQGSLALIPAGGEAELAFGPIEDLRLRHRVLDQSEGDRGFINRANAKSDRIRMDIENLGKTAWQVEVQGAVPFTADEDLQITWEATPAPDQVNLEDRRGVLQWELDVAPGTTQSILIEENLRWPEGKILR